MKKKHKIIGVILFGILAVTGVGILLYNLLHDENRLSSNERNWIQNNTNTVVNVNVVNDLELMGNGGKGIFYDFLTDLSSEYSLKLNPVTYQGETSSVEDGFKKTNTLDDKFVTFYEDYYVLLGKSEETITSLSEISGKTIGVLKDDVTLVAPYLPNVTFRTYDTLEELNRDLLIDLDYFVVPRYDYLDSILSGEYSLLYHFSDIKVYYGYQMKDTYFSSILKKYAATWVPKNIDSELDSQMYTQLVDSLSLTDAEITELTSKVYQYGFIEQEPYDVLTGGTFGGITSVYLKRFSDITGVEFKFTKYKTYKLLTDAIANGDLDIYYNYYTLSNDYSDVTTGMTLNYVVVAPDSNDLVVHSIDSLRGKEVYILQDSLLMNTLKDVDSLTIQTYKNKSDVKKLAKSGAIFVMDTNTYAVYSKDILDDYTVRFTNSTTTMYNFKVVSQKTFYKVLTAYLKTQDPYEVTVTGFYNYNETISKGTLLGSIAEYSLTFILILAVIVFIIYRATRKVRVSKRIKKDGKLRYIDQLTSLKNRNYLNENISAWNKNTIYPQATIVLDLNRVQEINDTLGYAQGDTQIKAGANILIKTQLDHTDIIRTNGNEFLVYLVGYDERQVVTYIKKLYKEFKNLPYNYGAAIGYSMILDDLKTIEDAINEAVDDMKNKKHELLDDKDNA